MTRMRDSMPVILITLVVAFLLTIVFEWGMDYLGIRSRGADHIGKIDDRTITYQEFTELVRQASENEKAQTKVEPDEFQLAQIRDQVWNQLVTQTIVEEQIQRLGLTVSDQEITDWVFGPNPPEFLRRQFIDSTGQFRRSDYENALRDPKNAQVILSVEKTLRQQRLQEKLQSLLTAAVRPVEAELYRHFVDQNVKLEAEFILFDPAKLVSDTLEVTESDIKKFYNEHSDDYKVEATRRLKYLLFRDEPSTEDSQSVFADIRDVLKRVSEGAEFVETADQYGKVQNTGAFFKHGELDPVKEKAVFSAKVGSVVGPLEEADGVHLIKILEERQGTEEYVHASHILIKVEGTDSVGAKKRANQVLASAKRGEKFEDLAMKFSQDPGSAMRGGDLGWFGKGRMVKSFEDAAFRAKAGQIVGPVKTQFGYHVVKVTDRSKREVRIADLDIPIQASPQTRNTMFQRAQDFQYLAKESGFEEAASQLGFTVLETPPFSGGNAIPGVGTSELLSKFAMNGKVGDVSDVVSLSNGYGVFIIAEAKQAGIRPLDEVRDIVKPRVVREKKMERVRVLAEERRKAIQPADSLGVAVVGHPELSVQRTGPFTLGGFVASVGRDLNFLGAVSALKVGEISKPVEGQRGYYLVKLLSRSAVDSAAYQVQRPNLYQQMLQEKRSQFLSQWIENAKKEADIEDNRELFFR